MTEAVPQTNLPFRGMCTFIVHPFRICFVTVSMEDGSKITFDASLSKTEYYVGTQDAH
jgi:hypothetical protein